MRMVSTNLKYFHTIKSILNYKPITGGTEENTISILLSLF